MDRALFQNAVTSIELGVEDFQNADSRRLTSAVRNLYAGVLLLFKCVLERHSPPGSDGALIYLKIEPELQPDGTVALKGKGNTVDRNEIESRMKALKLVVDWAPLKVIARIRNDMEHLHYASPRSQAEAAFSNALPLITSLVEGHLKESPAKSFTADCWAFLTANEKIYEERLARCRATFQHLAWVSSVQADAVNEIRCSCGSELVRQTHPENTELGALELECADCLLPIKIEDVFEAAISDATYADQYIAMTDGGEPPLAMCEECLCDSWYVDEDVCLMPTCLPPRTDKKCRSCGNRVEPSRMNTDYGVCIDCAYEIHNQ
jgi:hypothetical protein